MRHLLIEKPDGTFQLGVNEPASETLAPEIQENVVTEVTETASGVGNDRRALKIILSHKWMGHIMCHIFT